MKVGIVMDPIQQVVVKKNTSLAMLLEAQARGHELYYMESGDLWLQEGMCWARMDGLRVKDDPEHWFEFHKETVQPLAELDILLMRKDPPFNMNYIYLTYLLEQAEAQGLHVVNKPASLRDANEKLFAAWFPQCCPKTIVSSSMAPLHDFVKEEGKAVLKPLDGMGGASIFMVDANDLNLNVILETMTKHETAFAMAQRFIPEISEHGDKRIILINGEPVPYALARFPTGGDFRGNISSGGRVEGVDLTDRDRWLCEQVGPTLAKKGLIFVGLDVIGDYITEINVTSPMCIRELDAIYNLNIAGDFFDCLDTLYHTE